MRQRLFPGPAPIGIAGPRYFEMTGEFRAPKRGEYFISGAVPEAYYAPNDLTTPYQIARPATTPPREIVVDGFRYRRGEPDA